MKFRLRWEPFYYPPLLFHRPPEGGGDCGGGGSTSVSLLARSQSRAHVGSPHASVFPRWVSFPFPVPATDLRCSFLPPSTSRGSSDGRRRPPAGRGTPRRWLGLGRAGCLLRGHRFRLRLPQGRERLLPRAYARLRRGLQRHGLGVLHHARHALRHRSAPPRGSLLLLPQPRIGRRDPGPGDADPLGNPQTPREEHGDHFLPVEVLVPETGEEGDRKGAVAEWGSVWPAGRAPPFLPKTYSRFCHRWGNRCK